MGREGWTPAQAGKTDCRVTVEESDTAEGQHCGLLTLGAVEQWGVQFGQNFAAGEKGKTYTFAAFAKSMKGPVEASLQIERNANPWDRAATTGKLDDVPTARVKEFEIQLYRFLETERPQILADLGKGKTLTDDIAKALGDAVDDVRKSFLA